jgi:superfamily II DNA/RNA helicase
MWETVVPSFLAEVLSHAGYPRPSSVQVKALPLVRLGLDVVVHARAGTGKTLVFAIAAAEKALSDGASGTRPTAKPRVLFLAPTREIALQGGGVLSDVASACGMTVITCIGGLPVAEDERLLRKGCDVVVGTPGRLAALMVDRGCLDPSCIDMLVLDEADRLTESPFYEDVLRMVQRFDAERPYQMVALSATFHGRSVERLERVRSARAKREGRELFVCEATSTPVSVVHYKLECGEDGRDGRDGTQDDDDGGGGGGDDGQRENDGNNEDAGSEIDAQAMGVEYARQLEYVFGRVPFRQAIVFCPSRKAADATTRALVAESHAAALLSSDMDQLARIRALNDLRQYRTRVLVSTDVASRGIDLPNVDLVCNVGRLPGDCSTLQHRIGRAGRFGQPGVAVTLVGRGGPAVSKAVLAMLDTARDFREYNGVKKDVDVHARESVVIVRRVAQSGGEEEEADGDGDGDEGCDYLDLTGMTAAAGHLPGEPRDSPDDAEHRLVMEASLFTYGDDILQTYASHFDMIVKSCAGALQSSVQPGRPEMTEMTEMTTELSSSLRLLAMAFSKVECDVDASAAGWNKNSRSLGTIQSRGMEASLLDELEAGDVLMAAMADRDAVAREAEILERLMLG